MLRPAVSLGLLAGAVLPGAHLWFVDKGSVTTGEREWRKRNLLPAYRRREMTELVIQTRDATTRITRTYDDAGSEMFHLDDGQLADQTAVDKTLSALEFATPERR